MKKTIRNFITTVIFSLLGIGLMVGIYRGFDFTPVRHVFSAHDNFIWILLSLLSGIAANIFRSFRWKMLLQGAGVPIRLRKSIELVFISYLINSITPRLGELTRSLLVRRGSVGASVKAFGTIVVEKMADLGCLLIIVTCVLILRWEEASFLVERSLSRLNSAVSSALLYGVVGVLLLLVFILTWSKVSNLRILVRNLWRGMVSISNLSCPGEFLVWCLLIWVCNFLQLYLLLPCFDSLAQLGVLDALFLFASASVGVLLPTPGGAGPWHYAIIKTLTGVFGVEVSGAKLFALVTHGLKTALVMLLGLLAYLTFYFEKLAKIGRRKIN